MSCNSIQGSNEPAKKSMELKYYQKVPKHPSINALENSKIRTINLYIEATNILIRLRIELGNRARWVPDSSKTVKHIIKSFP